MVYGVGETVLDILFREDQPRHAVPGGSTFNAIISLARCGVPAAMVTETGDDYVGEITLRYLDSNAIDTRYVVQRQGMKSHVSLAFLDEQSDAHYSFYKDHNAWSARPLVEAARSVRFTAQDGLLLGSFFAVNPMLREVVTTLLSAAQQAGALCYYDVNFRQPHAAMLETVRPLIEQNMQAATLVRGSMDDMRIVYGLSTPEEVYQRVRAFCPYLIITDGAAPIRLFTPQLELRLPNPPLTPVSTVGAGDNFNAGVLYALMRLQERTVATDSLSSAGLELSRLTEEDWLTVLRTGQAAGRAACMSWSNSVTSAEDLSL